MSTCLVVINPQIDFLDQRDSPVPVPGSTIDMMNTTDLIYQYGDQIDRVVVSLDQHPHNHIAHPEMWIDYRDRNPKPYERVTYADILAGRWRGVDPDTEQMQAEYVRDAEKVGFGLVIWPKHCIIGSQGASMFPTLSNDLGVWSNTKRRVFFFNKSTNWSTDHVSSFKPVVTRANDESTWFNLNLWYAMQADTILLVGESLSHALQQTIKDAIGFPNSEIARRMIILEDCTSPRDGCKVQAEDFLHWFVGTGGRVSRSDVVYKHTLENA